MSLLRRGNIISGEDLSYDYKFEMETDLATIWYINDFPLKEKVGNRYRVDLDIYRTIVSVDLMLNLTSQGSAIFEAYVYDFDIGGLGPAVVSKEYIIGPTSGPEIHNFVLNKTFNEEDLVYFGLVYNGLDIEIRGGNDDVDGHYYWDVFNGALRQFANLKCTCNVYLRV